MSLHVHQEATGQYGRHYDYRILEALRQIKDTYGETCIVKPKTLLKFGDNDLVQNDDFCTLMTLPSGVNNETFVSDNLITTISSSSGSDDQSIAVEGHTISGNNLTFVTQTATLDGQNKVTLGTPLARCTRLYNAGSTDLSGNVYAYQDDTITSGVPDTGTKVHCIIPYDSTRNGNSSFKCATSISYQDYYIVTNAFASINQKSGTPIAELEIQVRQIGGVFRTVAIATVSTAGGASVGFDFDPAIIVPKNSDIRMRAKTSSNNVSVSGWLNGYLALVQS